MVYFLTATSPWPTNLGHVSVSPTPTSPWPTNLGHAPVSPHPTKKAGPSDPASTCNLINSITSRHKGVADVRPHSGEGAFGDAGFDHLKDLPVVDDGEGDDVGGFI